MPNAPAIPAALWRARWNAFRHPLEREKVELLARRWTESPEELKTPNQISGRHLTHCGFTLGASYCSFHCTHCRLPKNASDAPIPRRDASIFGHPDCNPWSSLLVSARTGEYCSLLPGHPKWDRVFGNVLECIGGLSLVTDDGGTASFRLLGVLEKNPVLTLRLPGHLARRVGSGQLPAGLFLDLFTGRVHTIGVAMHNFMAASEVARAAEDPVIRAHLDSCVFKGAVKENGEWVAVPMCKMNEAKWSEVYAERIARTEPIPPSLAARG